MSENTPNLLLPFLLASQAQKHVTVNEALRILDGLVQLSVLEARAAPPVSPVPGARYLVSATASGLWVGWEGSVALRDDNAWRRLIPQAGWLLWNVAAEEFQRFDGTAWVTLELGANVDFASGEIEALGVATQADATNRLAVAAPAALLTHAGAGHQLKINKAAAGDTASVLFQTGFSGRAEMGLAGEDDFSFKVSPDGAQWRESIRINRSTGKAVVLGVRETLLVDRTYFVRKNGNDANSGLNDNAAGAFLTIGRAIDVAFGELDLGPFNVTIQVRDGVYEEAIALPAPSVGAGSVLLRGNATNPGAVVIRVDSGITDTGLGGVLGVWNGAFLRIADLQLERLGGPTLTCIDCRFGGHVLVEEGTTVRFGTSSTAAIRLVGGYFTGAGATLVHVGNANNFLQSAGGNANLHAATINVDGRHYGNAVLRATRGGIITNAAGNFAITGTATGPRVFIQSNGVIDVGSFPLSSIPGSSDGTIETGGVYLPGFGEVVERGSNANGEFIRYRNGVQICARTVDLGARNTHGAGTYADPFRSNSVSTTFAAEFLSPPAVTATGRIPTGNAQGRGNTIALNSNSTTAVTLQASMLSSAGGSDDVEGHLIAIGRWK